MPSPKTVKEMIGSAVALLDQLQASRGISPKQAKTPPKQNNSYINKTTKKRSVDDPVSLEKQLLIPVTRMYFNKTTEKYSVNDSGTPQEQTYTPVTRKHINKSTHNYSEDDSVAPKEQLHRQTRNYVNKTIKIHSADDLAAPQEQLHSPVKRKIINNSTKKSSVDNSDALQEQLHSPVKRKIINNSTKKSSVDNSDALQEQLHSPVKRKYRNKTTKKHSEDDSVTQQKQSHSPVTRQHVNKTTEKHSVDDSVAPQEQLHIPVTRKHVTKTTKKHSVDDLAAPPVTRKHVTKTTKKRSVDEIAASPVTRKQVTKTKKHSVDNLAAPQEQLHSSVNRKCINKTTKKCSVDNSVTPQVQLHSHFKRKYINKTKKYSEDDSVTQQEQSHSPVTRKYDDKTTEKQSVDYLVTPREQLHIPVTRQHVNKTTEKHSVDDPVSLEKQLLIPVTRKYLNKTTEKYSVDVSGTPQEQTNTSVTRKHVNKKTHNYSEDDSVAPKEQLHSPITRNVNKTIKKHSADDLAAPQEQLHSPVKRKYINKTTKKRSEDNSDALQEQSHSPVTIKHVNKTTEKHSVDDSVAQQEQSTDILSKEGLATTEVCENVAARLIIRPRKRPKGSALTKSKMLNEKEIPIATPVLEKVLENISPPPQPNNRPNSSNKSNLTWRESSISSGTNKCVTVTSSECVPFNNRLEQLENPEQQNMNYDNFKQMYLREISRNESSSSDSESNSPSSRGVNTIPKPKTHRLPLSDEQIKFCRQKIKHMNKVIEDFKAEINTLCPHHDDLCTDSYILNGGDPHINDIIDQCVDFEGDLEAMMQQAKNSEKPNHHRTADSSAQNGSEIRSLEESRRSSYEENRSEASSPERYRLRQNTVHKVSEREFANPCLLRHVSASSSRDTSSNLPEQLVSNINQVEATLTDSFETFTSDNFCYESFDRADDDDDALSLYAESISALDTIRLDSVASVSNVSLHDVYVPSYEDSEIITNADEEASVSNSGSSAKNRTKASGLLEDSNRTSAIAEDSIKRSEAQISSQPRRLFSSYQKANPVRSSLYRGVCFFYLSSKCKNSSCPFIHVILSPNTFKFRLQSLDEDSLIAEYLLMCVYKSLKRRYYLLFVEECNRRKATRIFFEMAIDLGLGYVSIDEDIRVKILETALLHLNMISIDVSILCECDDLLKFEHKGKMMCDVLLSCMANSQNFTQFKLAFVKLVQLMCELNRPADIQVASSILERVCILPWEDLLARGMLALMKNTDASIFENTLASSFEVQLANIDSDAHAAYLLAKKAALEGRLAQLHETYPTTPPIMPCVVLNAPRQTRPDSNNVDNLHEPLSPVNSTPRPLVKPRWPRWRKGNTRGHYNSHQRNN